MGRSIEIIAAEKNEAKFRESVRKLIKASDLDNLPRHDVRALATKIGSWCAAFSQSPYIRQRAARLAIQEAARSHRSRATSLVRMALSELDDDRYLVEKRGRVWRGIKVSTKVSGASLSCRTRRLLPHIAG
ncbi:hypothetical protein AB2N04_16710 [Nitratireductor sp. GISD-1A_MAKvit]|uniref:hypothetical protein n=1 Tax=Nitratireductor sp. GISD-1A_MAKvit TaxID=3234198 RepID=UPI00346536E3